MRCHCAKALFVVILATLAGSGELPRADGADLDAAQVATALRRALQFYRTQVAVQGGFLWRYSADLSAREGENTASATTAWVQPPGTPSAGEALLDVYQLTGDAEHLAFAREVGQALRQGQLLSGGWDYRIEFDPRDRKKYAYRVGGGPEGARNATTLDDDNTQSALRFLMRLDHTLKSSPAGRDAEIAETIQYAWDKLLAAQYPNGAWPQRFKAPPDPNQFPVKPAAYPASWPREFPNQDYTSYYTFNDNTIADMVMTLFLAHEVYGEDRFRAAAVRTGQFVLLARMPEPQPAWAQQYNAEMQPAWARKFEPPSITGGESQGLLRLLLELHARTGDQQFLAPIPRTIEYLRASQLSDGRLARFYELQTNRPLYFTRKYELTYRDNDLPTHYGFIVGSNLDRLEQQFQEASQSGARPKPLLSPPDRPKPNNALIKQAAEVVRQLDQRGAWVESGKLASGTSDRVIVTATFSKNIRLLAAYLAASQSPSRSK